MGRIRVCVVEDNAVVSMDLVNVLQRLGYDVCGRCGDGESAVRLAQQARPDVVLMDIRLAGPMDGVEAARRIVSSLDLPVVFLTGHADRATFDRACKVGVHGYLLKPFDDLSIRNAVEVAYGRAWAEARRGRGKRRRAPAPSLPPAS